MIHNLIVKAHICLNSDESLILNMCMLSILSILPRDICIDIVAGFYCIVQSFIFFSFAADSVRSLGLPDSGSFILQDQNATPWLLNLILAP